MRGRSPELAGEPLEELLMTSLGTPPKLNQAGHVA